MMNRYHGWCCQSFLWRRFVAEPLVPMVLGGITAGPRILEIGPGYGATTDVLAREGRDLTALDVDPRLAERLRERFGTVEVVNGDGAAMPFQNAAFDMVVCFMMLHHVPSPEHQDRLFAEAHRVLEPGGVFAGGDSLPSLVFRLSHLSDTMVPVPPETLDDRLRAAGFEGVVVRKVRGVVLFRARKTG